MGRGVENRSNLRHLVLVHGLIGWGRDELQLGWPFNGFALRYFGGITSDIQGYLGRRGNLAVHTASVGPLSSDWDRACELYGQLTGTRVDYGAVHAKQAGHSRFGRDYRRPFFRGWGPDNKVSFIGHSMGGTTCRLLIHLLDHGAAEELAGHEQAEAEVASGEGRNPQPVSPLFEGGKAGWVHSLSSVSTPHDGTSLVSALGMDEGEPQAFIALLAAFLNASLPRRILDFKGYNLDLDHWQLPLRKGLSLFDFCREVVEQYKRYKARHPDKCPAITCAGTDDERWDNFFASPDTLIRDASPGYRKEINARIRESVSVYYFSYANSDTKADPANNNQHAGGIHHFAGFNASYCIFHPSSLFIMPLKGLFKLAKVKENALGRGGRNTVNFSRIMGGHVDAELGIDDSWWPNDGIVNTISMTGPKLGRSEDSIEDYPQDEEQVQPGRWYYRGDWQGWDHGDTIGFLDHQKKLTSIGTGNLIGKGALGLIALAGTQFGTHDVYGFYDDILAPVLKLKE